LTGVRSKDIRKLAIDSLIDDRLRADAARQAGIKLSEEQLQAAMKEFAAARKMTVKQMMAGLRRSGITRQAMIDLVENQAAFREAMRQRFVARATPTDSEIEAEQSLGLGTPGLNVRLAELVIPVAERGELRTAKLVEKLYDDLSRGASFAAAVRKYSRAPTASRGGDVGWMPLDRLPPSIGSEIAVLKPGQITRPINVPKAVVILKLVDSKPLAADAAKASDVEVTVGRLIVPLKADASETDIAAARVEADKLTASLKSCSEVEAKRGEYGKGSGIEGPVKLTALPEAERNAIARLNAGQVSAPVRTSSGMSVLVVCARSGGVDPEAIKRIRDRLFQERMISFAQGFLQELRRDAVIEYR
ncbi:MAG: hypothetical protein D6754_12605, partial [Alphaproteobacteria bacterium]